jgi:hypothetical protein
MTVRLSKANGNSKVWSRRHPIRRDFYALASSVVLTYVLSVRLDHFRPVSVHDSRLEIAPMLDPTLI